MLNIARRLDIAVFNVTAAGGGADKGTVRQCEVVVLDPTTPAGLTGREEAIHGKHQAAEAMALALKGTTDRSEGGVGQ